MPIYGLMRCNEDHDVGYVISNVYHYEEIKNDLVNLGIPMGNIITVMDWEHRLRDDMYFDHGIFCADSFCVSRYFVDVGSLDGTDTLRYLHLVGDENAYVLAVEPDNSNFLKTKGNLERFKNVIVENVGLSDVAEWKSFYSTNDPCSCFEDGGESVVKTTPLDDLLQGKQVSAIKMDIEGYEERALRGAAHIIKEQKPALMISVYHRRSDIWKLPKLVLDLNAEYKLYLRHYTMGTSDTVLYAV